VADEQQRLAEYQQQAQERVTHRTRRLSHTYLAKHHSRQEATEFVERRASQAETEASTMVAFVDAAMTRSQAQLAWAFDTPGGVRSTTIARATVKDPLGVKAIMPSQLEFECAGLPSLRISQPFMRVTSIVVSDCVVSGCRPSSVVVVIVVVVVVVVTVVVVFGKQSSSLSSSSSGACAGTPRAIKRRRVLVLC
jgi:hypothetical protein